MIDGLKPYPAMKDSRVPWLGEVPEHWEVNPNRALFEEIKDQNHPDEPLLSVTISKGVIRQSDLLSDTSKKDSSNLDRSKYKLVQPGDIAYNKMRAWQGAIGLSAYRGIISPAYIVQRPRVGAAAEYMHYLLRTPGFAKEAERWSYGITSDMWSLRSEHFKMIYCSVPPLAEQYAIVRFLDHADRRIRRYIRAKQKLIKLLEEQKQVIIHRAVTRGLDPNVRLKPSGVEWVGEIPEHWEILRGKYVGRLFSTPSVSDNDLTENPDSHPMYLKVSDLACTNSALMVKESKLYVKGMTVDAQQQYKPFLVFPKRGGAIYTNKVAIVQSLCLLDPNLMGWSISDRFEPLYVALLLKSRTLADLADVSSVPQLNNKHINPISFPAPPRSEQIAILARLDDELAGVSRIISRTSNKISLLREYRTRLIADVVTGKLDVREAAGKLPDEALGTEPLDEIEDVMQDDSVAEDIDIEAADAA